MNGWKKLLIPIFAILFITVVIGFSGCDLLTASSTTTTQPSKGIIVTRYQDIEGGVFPPTVTNFGAGDVPAVYVNGYGGQTVTLKIYDNATGIAIKSSTASIPAGMNQQWWFNDLPKGSYKAVLYVGGIGEHAANFWVN
jgi:hypothetical protein